MPPAAIGAAPQTDEMKNSRKAKMSEESPKNLKTPANAYPAWSPRFWHGMRTATWWRLLAKNGFRIAPSRIPSMLGVSLFTPVNDLLAIAQSAIYGRSIRRTEVSAAPLFILGHWRSGTTLLHEMLVSDPQFVSPSTYQCFAPSHFILTEKLVSRFGNFLLPKTRPMDNMEAGWHLPQEDEFALMNLGVPTPYLKIAFPKTQPPELEYLSLSGLSDAQRSLWREKFMWFLKAISFHQPGKRMVLKSPPHTGRIRELSQWFPDSKFIHLTRDPRSLFSSTMRLWRSLYAVQAFQPQPSEDELSSYVAECLTQMYAHFEESRKQIDPSRIVDVRYEDLVAEPIATLRSLYEHLDLGDFGTVEPHLQQRLQNHDAYRTNDHQLDPDLERMILNNWTQYATRYGYGKNTAHALPGLDRKRCG